MNDWNLSRINNQEFYNQYMNALKMQELEGLMAASRKNTIKQQDDLIQSNSKASITPVKNNPLRNSSMRASILITPSIKSPNKNEVDNDDPDVALNKMRNEMMDNKLNEFKAAFYEELQDDFHLVHQKIDKIYDEIKI